MSIKELQEDWKPSEAQRKWKCFWKADLLHPASS
jgi:hypothetical protein